MPQREPAHPDQTGLQATGADVQLGEAEPEDAGNRVNEEVSNEYRRDGSNRHPSPADPPHQPSITSIHSLIHLSRFSAM